MTLHTFVQFHRNSVSHLICSIFLILCFSVNACLGGNLGLLSKPAPRENYLETHGSTWGNDDESLIPHKVNSNVDTTNALDVHVFDNLYRLTSETITGGTLNGSINYGFDAVSNRTSRSSTVAGVTNQTHTYSLNDLLSHHTYDDNGSTTESPDLVNNTGVTNDVYDFRNKLVRRTSSSGDTIEFLYNADGHRVRKEVKTGGILNIPIVSNYLVDNANPTGYSQVVEETNGNGILERSYHIGHQRFAMSDHVNGGDISYYSFDGHGSIRGLTNATGDVIEEYDFDSYGILIGFRKDEGAGLVDQDPSLIGGLSRNEFLFAGEQWDADMGMYYNRARYYDVENGRFNAMDTWEGTKREPLTLNKYLFGGANPITHIDPSGNSFTVRTAVTVAIRGVLASIRVGRSVFSTQAYNLNRLGVFVAEFAGVPTLTFGGGAQGTYTREKFL